MTKEITKANILQEMQDKFKLREFDPTPFLFAETVIPTYDIETHVENWEHKYKRKSIISASAFNFFEVPGTERWHLRGYNVIFLGVGAIKIAGAYIRRVDSPTLFLYLDLTKNQTISYAVNMPQPVVLNPGDLIYVLCDDYTSTQDLDMTIDVIVEEIR